MLSIVNTINSYLSDYVLVFLLIAVGLWYTFKTRFVQVRYLGTGLKEIFGGLSLSGGSHGGGMSSFQAVATAIAAQVGTGNIVGSAGAILTGGPGAIFWMWIIAFLGMATIYAEAILAQETRVKDEKGNIQGGPVYYITKAFPNGFGKGLATFFALAIILALGFFGCMVQSNSIGSTIHTAFGIPSYIVGIALVIVCGFIFLGGVDRLASVTEKLVPIMAGFFLLGALIVLAVRIKYVPETFALIFKYAFQPQAIIGGGFGAALKIALSQGAKRGLFSNEAGMGALIVLAVRIKYVPETFALIFKYAFQPQAIIGGGFGAALKIALSQGAKRGLFSNEAGMGSTPHAHALAQVESPHVQGTVAIASVFIDTFIVLTLNALVIISTLYAGNGPLAGGCTPELAEIFVNTNLAQKAFGVVFGEQLGAMFVAVALFFFAFSTILGWNLFAKINVTWLFGEKAQKPFLLIALVFIFLGTIGESDLVWGLSDLFNQLMVIPNALALFALTGVVVTALNKYTKK